MHKSLQQIHWEKDVLDLERGIQADGHIPVDQQKQKKND